MTVEERFEQVVRDYGPALWRVARGYEWNEHHRRDLYQDILVETWRALPAFEGRSSLKTYVLRIAYNVARKHAMKGRQLRDDLVSLEALEPIDPRANPEGAASAQQTIEVLARAIRSLKPMDRDIFMLHLEGMDPAEIAEVTGVSRTNVTTKVHRIRAVLSSTFRTE